MAILYWLLYGLKWKCWRIYNLCCNLFWVYGSIDWTITTFYTFLKTINAYTIILKSNWPPNIMWKNQYFAWNIIFFAFKVEIHWFWISYSIRVSECVIVVRCHFSAISWREQVNFQWNNNEVRSVLDQHA